MDTVKATVKDDENDTATDQDDASVSLTDVNPAIDVQIRTRQLMEHFGVSAADLASVDVNRILAIRVTSPEQLILMLCNKPERDAYLVAARLAFENQAGGRPMSALGQKQTCAPQ